MYLNSYYWFLRIKFNVPPAKMVSISSADKLCVTSYDEDFREALKKSYGNIEKISYDGKYCRRDIGQDLMRMME